MPADIICRILWIFFLYSFLGWILETIASVARKKRFVNRGVLNGPLCGVYGIAALVITAGTEELKDSWFFLFLGSMILATVVEWFTGKLLEKMHHHRWWDYSERKWNLDGYICVQYSVIWGLLGAFSVRYVNPLLFALYRMIPFSVLKIILIVLLVLLFVDGIGSYMTIFHITGKLPGVEEANNKITAVTLRFGNWIAAHVENRMYKAHPGIGEEEIRRNRPKVFAEGCSFYKLAALFFIGAFLGDITETVFCRITAGVWMSRSSVVWGPFSIVWGLAMVLATMFLYNYRTKPDSFIFVFGTVLGGAYEYVCSVFTEFVFGKVFWDYSKIPFNLGGRINLLYCFFWGIAAVIWLKLAYPLLSKYIEKIPMKAGKIISWVLIFFMVINMCVSSMALTRYSTREQGRPAQASWEKAMDKHFDDVRMERIYPNAKTAE